MRILFIFYSLFILYILGSGITLVTAQEPSRESVIKYVATWGNKGNEPSEFKDPHGISVDPRGFLYVADTGNQRVQKFDSTGLFVIQIGGFGWEKEHFDEPLAVSARNGLDVFIADYYNQRIERYDKDLNYLASFISSEDWPEHFKFGFPRDVDLSFTGELFCLDDENHRILKLDVMGNPQISFGGFDAGEGRLIKPQRMVVSDNGMVYVSDEEGGRIVVFDIHGNYFYSLCDKILERPAGITIMKNEFILVSDAGKGIVFIFQEHGRLVTSFNGAKEMGIRFKEPVDIDAWKGRIYVLDRKRCVVDLFKWSYKKGK